MLLRHPKRDETSPNVAKRNETLPIVNIRRLPADGAVSCARRGYCEIIWKVSAPHACVSVCLLVCVLGLTANLITYWDDHIEENIKICVSICLLGLCIRLDSQHYYFWRRTLISRKILTNFLLCVFKNKIDLLTLFGKVHSVLKCDLTGLENNWSTIERFKSTILYLSCSVISLYKTAQTFRAKTCVGGDTKN